MRQFDRSLSDVSPWARFRALSVFVQALVWATAGVAIVVVGLLVFGGRGTPPAIQGGRIDAPVTAATTSALLAALEVAPENPRTGYRRDLFELSSASDADHDGCDTRQEVLIVESVTPAQEGPGCSVDGRWLSAYDGVTVTVASQLDLDHLVAVAEAWDSGAATWDPARRGEYANDLGYSGSLVAVSASSNRSKGDRDPADWLPPRLEARCQYAVDWISVKVRWGLTADQDEVQALQTALDTCTAPVPAAPPVVPPGAPDWTTSTATTASAAPTGPLPAGPVFITALDCGTERVTVANRGDAAVDLTGWSVHDDGARHTFTFPSGSELLAGQAVTVASGPDPGGTGELIWTGSSVWNNEGDIASLVDPGGDEVSVMSCSE